jgi:very-short-patch-repair endonuclease
MVQIDSSRFEVDFLWPSQRIVVEADGYRFHGNRVAFERDRRRDRELALGGYRVLRITWSQIEDEPGATMAAIGRVLGGAMPNP